LSATSPGPSSISRLHRLNPGGDVKGCLLICLLETANPIG
jgi:hypothetical protein